MVEPLASGVLNSLLTGSTSLKQSVCLHGIGRAASRAGGSVLAPEFLLTSTRSAKGKGKAVDLDHSRTVRPSQCREWSSHVSRWPEWPSARHRVTMMQELEDGRKLSKRNNTRRTTRQRIPAPTDLPYLFPRRHVSHATKAAQHAAPSTESTPNAWNSRTVDQRISDLQSLRSHSRLPPNQLNLFRAWHAYTAAGESNALGLLTLEQYLNTADSMLGAAEMLYADTMVEVSSIHTWGRRVQTILDDCKDRPPKNNAYNRRRLICMARSLALQGNIDGAIELLHSAVEKSKGHLDHELLGRLLQGYEGVLLSIWRLRGALEGLEFIMSEWEFLHPYVSRKLNDSTLKIPYTLGRSLHRNTLTMLTEIPRPENLISRKKGWDDERLLRTGSLLIEAHCAHGSASSGYNTMFAMKMLSLWPHINIQLQVVRTLTREDLYEQACEVFDAIVPTKPLRSHLSTGLNLYAHLGYTKQASEFFDVLQEQGWASSYDVAQYMFSYATTGDTTSVIQIFDQFFPANAEHRVPVNSMHYAYIIHSYAQRGDMDGIQAWLERMISEDISPDVRVFTTILRSFALRGDLDGMATIMQHMRSSGVMPNQVTYTVILSALADRKDSAGAEQIFKQAVEEGVEPDRRMVTSMMNVHTEAGNWEGVIRVFDYLRGGQARRLRLTVEVYNTLLKAYILVGSPFLVVSKVFSRMEQIGIRPDPYSYALLVQSACDSGLLDVATDIFRELEKLDPKRRRKLVNAYTLTVIMAGFLRTGDKLRAKSIYDGMRERDLQPTAISFHAILRAYGNERTEESLRIARDFIKNLTGPDAEEQLWKQSTRTKKSPLDLVYGPIIGAYSRQAMVEDAERMFQDLVDAGGTPSLGVLTKLLDAYRRAGDLDAIRELWPEIIEKATELSRGGEVFTGDVDAESPPRLRGSILSAAVSIYMDALSLAGLHTEVAELWKNVQQLGHVFDSHNWNHLVVALIRAGEVDRAFEVIEKVIVPLQRRSEGRSLFRDPNPTSPLTSKNSIKTETEKVSAEPPMRRLDNRSAIVKLASKALTSEAEAAVDEDPFDFTRPLHVLHELSPSWLTWAPHLATLSALLRALSQLRTGRLLRPMSPDSTLASRFRIAEDDDEIEVKEEAHRVDEMLARLYQHYPNTIRMVQDHELAERRRLGTNYHKTYH